MSFFPELMQSLLQHSLRSVSVRGSVVNLLIYLVDQLLKGCQSVDNQVQALQNQEIANYIKENTNENEKIFFYDYGAVLYRLSDRDSGTRFISASVLLLEYRDNYGFNFNKLFIEDMEKNNTKYVITYVDRDSLYYKNRPLVNYFDSHYTIEKKFDTLEVLRRNN